MEEKELQAKAVVSRYVWWSLAAGLVPVPVFDFVAVTGVQVKMLSDLAKVYGVPFKKDRVKNVVAALLGAVIPVRLGQTRAATMLRYIPLVGTVTGIITEPVLLGASTYAVGRVFTQHFASGGTFLDFDPAEVREHFRQEFAIGRETLSSPAATPQPESASA